MGGKKQHLVGKTFSRLTVIKKHGQDRHGKTNWICDCSCGKKNVVVNGSILVRGLTKSCGCFHKEQASKANKTHGLTKTREHRIWIGMLARCYNPNTKDYKNYGGRGITVCNRWRFTFQNFLMDMGNCPEGMTIERRKNNGNYTSSNCYWATKEEQANNTRANTMLYLDGKRQSMSRWAVQLGISPSVLSTRLQRGWSVRKALTTPLLVRKTKSRSKSHFEEVHGDHKKVRA